MTQKAACRRLDKLRQLRGIHPAQFHLIQHSYHLLVGFLQKKKSFETFEDLKIWFSSKVEVFETCMSLPLDAYIVTNTNVRESFISRFVKRSRAK